MHILSQSKTAGITSLLFSYYNVIILFLSPFSFLQTFPYIPSSLLSNLWYLLFHSLLLEKYVSLSLCVCVCVYVCAVCVIFLIAEVQLYNFISLYSVSYVSGVTAWY